MNLFNLKSLSNDKLVEQFRKLIHQERKLLHIILRHICEVERRQLHLERAFSSLYEYLIQEFGYSGAAAMRRIEAARLLRQLPELSQKIQTGAVNLSQLGEMSKAIKAAEKISEHPLSTETKTELLLKIENQTTAQTQVILAKALDIPPVQIEKKRRQQDESVRLELTLSKQQFEHLQMCHEQTGHALSQRGRENNLSEVIGYVCEIYLRKYARFPVLEIQKQEKEPVDYAG